MKKLILLITPPVILLMIKKVYLYLIKKSRVALRSYDDELFAGMIVEKNIIFNEKIQRSKTLDISCLGTVLGIGLAGFNLNSDYLKILDFGGGGGYHYNISRLILGDKIKIKWHIVETMNMVRMSEKLATDELHFFTNIEEARRGIEQFDLVLASSSLQYCSDQFQIIDELINLNPRYIFITRTPFSLNRPLSGEIQYSKLSSNGPGPLPKGVADSIISYPIYVTNLDDFLNRFKVKYNLRFQLKERSGEFNISGEVFDTYSFFFEKAN